MSCIPPYYPSPGHESKTAHDCTSTCLYYAVWAGRVRGVYSNSWIARSLTDGYTDARHKGFKNWSELETWWTGLCHAHHQGQCPPFEVVTFTLDPSPVTHPSSAPCSIGVAPAPALRVAPAPATLPAIRTAASSSSAATSVSTIHAPADDGIRKEESTTPALHLNGPPRVTPNTRVQLTPTGHARGTLIAQAHSRGCLVARAGIPRATGPRAPSPEDPPVPALDQATVAATPARARAGDNEAGPRPSVLVTPSGRAQAGLVAPAPANAGPEPAPQMFGIRGVSVFYSTHAAAVDGGEAPQHQGAPHHGLLQRRQAYGLDDLEVVCRGG
ncbi:hypothetical protein B0H14DRAFT_2585983 [Mycena olivaceomarginata]|nr:hypothetical protein B0H14DRAFT_2585983 [Mycena olivaceomarginata]